MNDSQTTLLVAERDESKREHLLANLATDGYLALGAQTVNETRLKLRDRAPALLVLGSLEQESRTLALLRAIRTGEADGDPTVPVIMIGDGGEELAPLRAFEAGCDHFMGRPFAYLELRVRVRACLRRAQHWRVPRRLTVGALVVDRDARSARHAGRALALTRLEFELLSYLAAAPTRVVTKPELLREVWGYRAQGKTRTLDAHACRLRHKLAQAGAPHLIHNTRGVGYRLSLAAVREGPKPIALVASGNGHAA